MAGVQAKNLDSPDRTQPWPKGPINIVQVGSWTIGRAVFQPGLEFQGMRDAHGEDPELSAIARPLRRVGSDGIRMDDGTELEVGPGDAVAIDPGHDAWTVGDEAFVAVDFHKTGE